MNKKTELQYMSELEEAVRLKPSFASTLLVLFIAGFVIFAIIWASIAEVDERVRGQGRVMPSSDIQVIQSLEGGILSELLVKEGEKVKAGQVLMRIDDVFFASEERGIEAQMLSLQIRKARLEAEAKGEEFKIPDTIAKKAPKIAENEKKLYLSRQKDLNTALAITKDEEEETKANLAEVKASINKLSRNRDLLKKELDIAKKLVAKHAMPEIEKLRLEREYSEIRGNLATALQSKKALQAKLSRVKKKRMEKLSSFRSKVLGELNETETKIAALNEKLKSAGDRVSRTDLKSPVDGIIKKIAVKTVGGVIEPAQRLIEIVPIEDELMIRSKVRPEDIAFLHLGQKVKISITAYEPQIYGYLWGKLERIGADAVRESDGTMYFEIDVRTDSNNLGDNDSPLIITPGMVANTEIIVGKRTILFYLLKPVLRLKEKALTEP